jgi:predicted site-specific integrase-resolvase
MKKKEKLKIDKKDLNLWYDNFDVMHILKISDSTLARYRKQEKIPFTKLGGKYFYPREFFENSMAAKMENKHLIEKK